MVLTLPLNIYMKLEQQHRKEKGFSINANSFLNIVLDKPAYKQQPYTEEDLHARIKESEEDIKAGRVYTMDEVTQEMEKKYPWLCD